MEKSFLKIKDIDLLMMTNLEDDEDLLNFCLTNSYTRSLCKNEKFWKDRLIKRFGKNSLKYKNSDQTYKNFYLYIIHFQSIGYNYNEESMKEAAKKGLLNLVDFFISKGADEWRNGKLFAEIGGHKELAEFFEDKIREQYINRY
jgi:hypothetical protein